MSLHVFLSPQAPAPWTRLVRAEVYTLFHKYKVGTFMNHRTPSHLYYSRFSVRSGINIQQFPDGTLCAMTHERLAIVDPLSGKQPLLDSSGDGKALISRRISVGVWKPSVFLFGLLSVCVTVNGEIYNHARLLKEKLGKHTEGMKYRITGVYHSNPNLSCINLLL